jgi:hypothetical protein
MLNEYGGAFAAFVKYRRFERNGVEWLILIHPDEWVLEIEVGGSSHEVIGLPPWEAWGLARERDLSVTPPTPLMPLEAAVLYCQDRTARSYPDPNAHSRVLPPRARWQDPAHRAGVGLLSACGRAHRGRRTRRDSRGAARARAPHRAGSGLRPGVRADLPWPRTGSIDPWFPGRERADNGTLTTTPAYDGPVTVTLEGRSGWPRRQGQRADAICLERDRQQHAGAAVGSLSSGVRRPSRLRRSPESGTPEEHRR